MRDTAIKERLREHAIAVQTFNSALLFEPWTVRSRSTGRPFQIFTAFWKECLSQPDPEPPAPDPEQLDPPRNWPTSLALNELELEPRIDWAGGLRATWKPGEAAAASELEQFTRTRLGQYAIERNFPAHIGTSRMSPHLHLGEIGPRTIWHALRSLPSSETYLREIGWREFAYHLLFHFPRTTNECLRSEFATFPWRRDAAQLRRWQRGKTGYPFVDAAMRELWATGWMHNRGRMVVASFLTKHLRISWEEGAYWFWDTLVDADLANNTLGWQWTAGCGADAAPYFRIFNPARQRERFPECEYVRKWVPELNQPDYPAPIIDHDAARREALAAFETIRARSSRGVS